MSENKSNPVRETRLALKLTQEQMCKKMGCGITSERRFEYNATLPTNAAVLANFKRLATKAGVSLEAPEAAQEVTT